MFWKHLTCTRRRTILIPADLIKGRKDRVVFYSPQIVKLLKLYKFNLNKQKMNIKKNDLLRGASRSGMYFYKGK